MYKGTIFVISICIVLAGCTSDRTDQVTQLASKQRSQVGEEYLAYEHSATIDLAGDKLAPTFHSVINACAADTKHSCTVLHSELSSGQYASASMRLRLKPDGVGGIVALAAENGLITQRSTHIEDIATPIIDSERRLSMLEAYLEDLLRLRDESRSDVEALITVMGEIAETQSELETLRGEHAYLRQRVDLDILNLRFITERSLSFWTPITAAFGDFSTNLSAGISEAVIGFAYLLPWLFILVPLAFLIRFLWRKLW